MTPLFFKILKKLNGSGIEIFICYPIYYSIYRFILSYYGAYIHLKTELEGNLTLPHGLHGVFISRFARIGKGVTIFHQVTIGSVQEKHSKLFGAPKIGDNVIIGPGAKIIGGITVGDNVRIGANCVVAQSIPSNTTVVTKNISLITNE